MRYDNFNGNMYNPIYHDYIKKFEPITQSIRCNYFLHLITNFSKKIIEKKLEKQLELDETSILTFIKKYTPLLTNQFELEKMDYIYQTYHHHTAKVAIQFRLITQQNNLLLKNININNLFHPTTYVQIIGKMELNGKIEKIIIKDYLNSINFQTGQMKIRREFISPMKSIATIPYLINFNHPSGTAAFQMELEKISSLFLPKECLPNKGGVIEYYKSKNEKVYGIGMIHWESTNKTWLEYDQTTFLINAIEENKSYPSLNYFLQEKKKKEFKKNIKRNEYFQLDPLDQLIYNIYNLPLKNHSPSVHLTLACPSDPTELILNLLKRITTNKLIYKIKKIQNEDEKINEIQFLIKKPQTPIRIKKKDKKIIRLENYSKTYPSPDKEAIIRIYNAELFYGSNYKDWDKDYKILKKELASDGDEKEINKKNKKNINKNIVNFYQYHQTTQNKFHKLFDMKIPHILSPTQFMDQLVKKKFTKDLDIERSFQNFSEYFARIFDEALRGGIYYSEKLPNDKKTYKYDYNRYFESIITTCNLPGVLIWHDTLDGKDYKIEELEKYGLWFYGFAHAIIKKSNNMQPTQWSYITEEIENKKLLYFTEELKYLKELGYDIQIYDRWIFSKKNKSAKEAIEMIKSKINPLTEEKGLLKFLKIGIQTFAGRQGYKTTTTKELIINEEKLKTKEPINGNKIKKTNEFTINEYDPKNAINQITTSNQAFYLAVISYSRIILHNKTKEYKVYQIKLDSIITDKKFPKEWIGTNPGEFKYIPHQEEL